MAKSKRTGRIQTPVNLLTRLKDWEDKDAWDRFEGIYGDLIRKFALKAGLDEGAAEEVRQETLLRVAKAIGTFKYDPKRCTFMSWLLLLTHSRVVDYKRHMSRRPAMGGQMESVQLEQIPDPAGVELFKAWEEEWRERLLHEAEKVVKRRNPRQWQIYDLYMKRGMAVKEVRETLKVSAAQVYLARTRVVKQLREEVGRLALEEEKG